MDSSPIMLALIPTEKEEVGDLHVSMAREMDLPEKNLHEVLDLLTCKYNRNDWRMGYSVCFYTSELENWGNRRVKVKNVQMRRVLFGLV